LPGNKKMKLENLKINTRLTIGFGSMAILTLLLCVLMIFGIKTMSANLENLSENRFPAWQVLAQLNRERMVIRAQTQSVFAQETQKNAEGKLQTILEDRHKAWQRIDKAWEILLKIPRTSAKGQLLQEKLQEQYKAWRAIYVDLDSQIERLARATDPSQKAELYAEYRQMVSRMVPISDAMGESFDAMADNNAVRTNNMIKADHAIAIQLQTWGMVAAVISIVLAALLGWLITRSVVAPLRQGKEILGVLAEGDMTCEIPSELTSRKDEMGDLARSMRDMANQLQEIVGSVNKTTSQVASASSEIAQGSSDLAQRTEEQASALEETASSMEELTSTVKQSADNAGQANSLAGAARTQAEQGGQVVDQAITAMSAINQSSRKIADIIGVIDEIAFQTNLLALNAAVEAARAGEQGRGFAVVAGEVRKLAQRSADAAKEIKTLITDSVAKVEDGSELVDRAGQTLRAIMTSVKKVSDIVAEMAAAAREQASGIEQVNKAILQMDQVTQQNAALVEETAAASHSMGDQAQELQRLMGFFKLDQQNDASTTQHFAKKYPEISNITANAYEPIAA
jgi:methyl-accepting chemotaxis protein